MNKQETCTVAMHPLLFTDEQARNLHSCHASTLVYRRTSKKPAQLPCVHSCLQTNKQETCTVAMRPLLFTDEQARNLHSCHASTLVYRRTSKKPAQLPCVHSCLQTNKQETCTVAMRPLLFTDEQARNLHSCHASTLVYRRTSKKPAQLPCVHSCLQTNKQETCTVAMRPLLFTDEHCRPLLL